MSTDGFEAFSSEFGPVTFGC